MSILSKIVSSIFGHASAAPAGDAGGTGRAIGAGGTGADVIRQPARPRPVDVEAILTKLAASNKEKLDWQNSIVDLMKLLNLNTSLTARKELADELHFTGDKNDSATMNIWLHKQVMQKLAENGGKVPDSNVRK